MHGLIILKQQQKDRLFSHAVVRSSSTPSALVGFQLSLLPSLLLLAVTSRAAWLLRELFSVATALSVFQPLTANEHRNTSKGQGRERGREKRGSGRGRVNERIHLSHCGCKTHTQREKKNPAEASTVEREEGEREGEKKSRSRFAREMDLPAVGEHVFAVEGIEKKRIRKVQTCTYMRISAKDYRLSVC